MYLYTLTPGFIPKDIITEFISAVWTERYSSSGDVQLVTPATADMMGKLAKGTFLGLRGTKEIMLLDTQSIEEGLLTVTGKSLLEFLDERPAWFENSDSSSNQATGALTADITAGELISSAVDQLVVNPVSFEGPAHLLNLNWEREKIPGLEIGAVDSNGSIKRLTLSLGTLYSSIKSLAEQEGLGLKLYLESSKASTGPVLKFATYRGKNRTSDQTTHSVVRLSPKTDSLLGVKELSSNSGYKNVVYVVYNDTMSIHYAEPTLPIPVGFARRVMVVEPENIFLDTEAKWQQYRDQTARDAFANNNYVETIDGQASPQGMYQFAVDYYLGDIIELLGETGNISHARITEYIRSQDRAGEREYPTLSVLDHLSTGMLPDTEPNPGDPPGVGDPDIDLDEPPEVEPEPDPGDPNPDPDPQIPGPHDPGDPGDPGDSGPNPNNDPIIVGTENPPNETGEQAVGISDTYSYPPTATGYYTLVVRSHIKVTFSPPQPWYTARISGPIFSIVIGNNVIYEMNPEEAMAHGHSSGHIEDQILNYSTDPQYFGRYYDESEFSGYFVCNYTEITPGVPSSLQSEPLSIPKYPQSRLFAISRSFSGPVKWYDHLDNVIGESSWQVIPEPGDITLTVEHHPF
jgi:hypothetical protein